jgi:hypothetical protein
VRAEINRQPVNCSLSAIGVLFAAEWYRASIGRAERLGALSVVKITVVALLVMLRSSSFRCCYLPVVPTVLRLSAAPSDFLIECGRPVGRPHSQITV